MKMHNIIAILGKAIVAIFLSLLLNYIYIAWVSRLKRPSDKKILGHLRITWGERYVRRSYDDIIDPTISYSIHLPQRPQLKTKNKKFKKANGYCNISRAERKRLNAKEKKQHKK